jgi:hypothetical protein
MFNTRTIELAPVATAGTATRSTHRRRRSARGLALVVALAAPLGGVLVIDAGPASALPPQCVVYATSANYQSSQANRWLELYESDSAAGDWSYAAVDMDYYDRAMHDYNSVMALYRASGC